MSIWWTFKVVLMNVMLLLMVIVMLHVVDLSHLVVNFDLPDHWVSMLSIVSICETVSSDEDGSVELEFQFWLIIGIEIAAPLFVVLKVKEAFWTLVISVIGALDFFNMLIKSQVHLDHLMDDIFVITTLLCFTAHFCFFYLKELYF